MMPQDAIVQSMQEDLSKCHREIQKYKNEMGKAMVANHNLRVEKRAVGADCQAMRQTMNEISDLAHRGMISEMLAVIENEQRIYEARRPKRRNAT